MNKLAVLAVSFMATFGLLLAPVAVHAADVNDNLCQGINFTAGDSASDCDNADAEDSIGNIVETIINIFSLIVGAVSVIMIILGGLRYITSSGDSGNVTAAKNTILYAIVGLVIVIFAQTIVRFVVARLTD